MSEAMSLKHLRTIKFPLFEQVKSYLKAPECIDEPFYLVKYQAVISRYGEYYLARECGFKLRFVLFFSNIVNWRDVI